jgi:hypothetical protein
VLVVNSAALLTTNASVTILSSVSTISNSAIYSIVVSERANRAPLRAASMSFEQRRACEFRTITSHAPHTTSQAPHTTSQAPHTRKSQNAEEMSLINFRSVMAARARRKTAEHNVQARVRGHLPDTPGTCSNQNSEPTSHYSNKYSNEPECTPYSDEARAQPICTAVETGYLSKLGAPSHIFCETKRTHGRFQLHVHGGRRPRRSVSLVLSDLVSVTSFVRHRIAQRLPPCSSPDLYGSSPL